MTSQRTRLTSLNFQFRDFTTAKPLDSDAEVRLMPPSPVISIGYTFHDEQFRELLVYYVVANLVAEFVLCF